MYRALAFRALREGVALDDAEGLARIAHDIRIGLEDEGRRILLDGDDVSADLRTREVSAAASRVSVHPPVRREMVRRQQDMGSLGGVVLDGRDIGTAVFPDADVKFYVDADPARRAARRHAELMAAGAPADLAAIEREIRERDHADSTRADSPLTRAAGAIDIDTTDDAPDAVVARMMAIIEPAAR
jgi:cytidylate kinase